MAPKPLLFRPYTAADRAPLLELLVSVHEDSDFKYPPLPQGSTPDELDAWLNKYPMMHRMVAVDPNNDFEIVGHEAMVAFDVTDQDLPNWFAAHPHWQEDNPQLGEASHGMAELSRLFAKTGVKGVAGMLTPLLIEIAQAHGFHPTACVLTTQKRSAELNIKNGWTNLGTFVGVSKIDNLVFAFPAAKSSAGIMVRPAVAADKAQISALYGLSQKAAGGRKAGPSVHSQRNALRGPIAHQLVAVDPAQGFKVVGHVAIHERSHVPGAISSWVDDIGGGLHADQWMSITGLVVDPATRSNGIGTMLVNEARGYVNAFGQRSVVEVPDAFRQSPSLLARAGLKPMGATAATTIYLDAGRTSPQRAVGASASPAFG